MKSKLPKLLMIFPSTLRGGVEEYNLTASMGALRYGWDVHAAFPQTEGTTSLIQDFTQNGITYHPLAIAEHNNRLPSSVRHLPQLLRTLRLLTALKPDVVQITLPAPDHCLGSILACGMLKVPTVVRFGLVLPLETGINRWRIKAYSWVRSRCQRWIVISQNNRSLLAKMFEISEREITCIYNGSKLNEIIALDGENKRKLQAQVRSELNLPEAARLLITVGRLNSQKGYSDLVPVIPHVAQDFPDVCFVWVGDGELRAALETQINDYHAGSKVVLLGYRSDVPRLLQAADLFVFPTHFEGGQSFAIAEAMACELPIITSNASGIPEVLHHRTHGLVFRAGDSCDLLESIRWALRHPDDMRAMAENAKTRAQDFTEEKMIQSYGEIWQDLYQISGQTSKLTHEFAQEPSVLLDTDRP